MKNKEMYLTDKQYYSILLKIKKVVNQNSFKPYCDDCNITGMKYTETNCGFCNDEFTKKETAMFPKDFPERKDMKYCKSNHKCPFDTRVLDVDYAYGCFYYCYLFQSKGKATVEIIREIVNKLIEEIEKCADLVKQ